MRILPLLTLTFILISLTAKAWIRLPSVVGSHMVLQQKSSTVLWGWSDPGEKIYVTTSWNNRTDSVNATGDAKWRITIPTPAAGGPYTITLRGSNTIVLNDILVGEVWVCSGQSNMEWSSYHNNQQIIDELPNATNNNIRLFQVPKTTAVYPQDDCRAEWKVCSPETLKGFSAVGYFFGKKLQSTLNVPIGLINASWGGTPAETWTPAPVVSDNPSLAAAAARLKPTSWWPDKPGRAFNAMIAPLTTHSIAGVIWYQGESNTETAATYNELMKAMIGSWRDAWKSSFPFYYVQIAPFKYGNRNIGALLREQQATTLELTRTGMVVTTDLVDNINDIHPKDKRTVGLRLAELALHENYKQPGVYAGYPTFDRMEIKGKKVDLYFKHAEGGLLLREGKAASDFYVAGSDQKFYPASVRLSKDRLTLESKAVPNPVAVRFAFDNVAMPNIMNKQGLPLVPFRTDNWQVDTSEEPK